MTSFLSIDLYSPALVFCFGILTYLGLIGTGLAIVRLFKIAIPSPWRWVAGVLLGILTESLLVQIAGMTGIACHGILLSIWLLVFIVGILFLGSEGVARKKFNFSFPPRWTFIVAIPVLLAILANLVAAIAPSTKIDELYYHMLLPSRIVTDQALVFYRSPLECAALPQMIYQFSLTPLHSIGFPDAGNVVSLALNLTLLVFGWKLIRRHGGSETWAWLWLGPLCIGMYPVIWQVTGGAFAMGDLATAAAVLALFLRDELLKKMSASNYYLLFSILILGAVSSKVSLFPLAFCMMLINGLFLFRTVPMKTERLKILGAISIPWIIFYLPILLWTWKESGSPFGPFLAGKWGTPSAYSLEYVSVELRKLRDENIPTVMGALKVSIIDYTPLMWAGVLMIFFGKTILNAQKTLIMMLLILQAIVVTFFLVFDLRYFGGLIQGLALLFAVTATAAMQKNLVENNVKVMMLTLFFLLPWLTIQIYYTTQFAGVVTGFQPKTEFYRGKTSFFEDYNKIDHLIPKDAVILFRGPLRLNIVYAPRAVYLTEADIPSGKPVFLMVADGHTAPGDQIGNFRVGEELYENREAVGEVFRTPGIGPKIRDLKVFSLEKR